MSRRKAELTPSSSIKYFRQCAESLGMSCRDLCDEVGIATAAMYKWSRGETGMSAETRQKIEDYMAPQLRPRMAVLIQRWDASFRNPIGGRAGDPAELSDSPGQ